MYVLATKMVSFHSKPRKIITGWQNIFNFSMFALIYSLVFLGSFSDFINGLTSQPYHPVIKSGKGLSVSFFTLLIDMNKLFDAGIFASGTCSEKHAEISNCAFLQPQCLFIQKREKLLLDDKIYYFFLFMLEFKLLRISNIWNR